MIILFDAFLPKFDSWKFDINIGVGASFSQQVKMETATLLRLPIRLSSPYEFASNPLISVSSRAKTSLSSNFCLPKLASPFAYLDVGRMSLGSRKSCIVKASSSSHSFESGASIAPLQLESPVGQFLSQILVTNPHLLPAAVDQQLDQLRTDLDTEKNKEKSYASGTELVLYRRIAEVKAKERRKALEEILYTLVIQKFMAANISLTPSISSLSTDSTTRVDKWSSEDEKVEQVHSLEAYEMILHHLTLILGNRLEDTTTIAQISKLRVGQVYAASVMYGYFLKRVDQRFQLEKGMKLLPEGTTSREKDIIEDTTSMANMSQAHAEGSSWGGEGGSRGHEPELKASRLRSYVMGFDPDSLARYATIRSKEAVTVVEKHTEALFGKPEIVFTPQGTIDPSRDELIKIGFGGLKRLVLEAVTFGSFLWDVDSYVESRCHFALN